MSNYKNLDVSACLKIGKPRKNNGIYESDTSFKVQTPDVTIDLDNSSISFRMINKGKFVTVLEDLENKIVSIIYNNSKDFFNGKTFTENKIRSSLEKLFSLDNNGVITLNNITIPSNMKVYDHFNEIVPDGTNKGHTVGSCILQLDTIKFVKNLIKTKFILTHLKLSVEKKKLKECILDDDIDNDNDNDNEQYPESNLLRDQESSEKKSATIDTVAEVEATIEAVVEPEIIEDENSIYPEYADFFEE